MFEQLEPRLLLDGLSPEFATDLAAGYVIEPGGGGLTIGIDGYDADSDALTITVATDNPHLTYVTPYDAGQPVRLAVLHFVESDGITPVGDIVLQLLEGVSGDSGDAVDRFITLATNFVNPDGTLDPGGTPFYTDVVVHRIIDEFMIQTGDADNGTGIGDSPLDDLVDNFDLSLSFMGTGVAAFANSGPDSSNSQFFITEAPTTWLDQGYMIFGQVISGWDTLETLSQYPTDSNDRPLDPPLLDYVEIVDSQQDATFTFMAGSSFSGNAEVTVTIEDADGNLVSRVITISEAMTMSGVPSEMTIFPGAGDSFTPTFSHSEGGTLQVQYETDDPALAGYVSVDPVTHEVTVNVPADTTAPQFSVRLKAVMSDFGNATEVESTFLVVVSGEKPEIENPGTLIVAPGETHSFFADITDDSPRDLDVTVSSGNPDVQVTIDPVNHEVQISAPTNFSGAYAVTISAVEQGFDNLTPSTETFYVFTSPAYEPQGVSQFVGPGGGVTTTAVVQLDDVLYVTRGDMSAYTGAVDTYDISDPANPVYLDSYTTDDRAWDIKVINTTRNGADATIAFVANLYKGIVVLDVTDPSDITEFTQFTVGETGDSYLDVALRVEIHEGHLYVSNWEDGLEVYDISNLDDVGNITHASRVKNLTGSLDLSQVVDFVASGDFGYVVDADGGFVALDISDPANIIYASSHGTGGSPWDAEIHNGVLYVLDDSTGLNTFSLDTPESPAFMGKTGAAIMSWTHLAVSGNIAVAAMLDGFLFVDVSDPYNPVNSYEFTGPSYGQSPTFFGDYAALPLVNDGVFIVDVQGTFQYDGGVWVVIGDDQPSSVTYTDADGTVVTVRLKGGTATLRIVGDNLQQHPGSRGITITGNDAQIANIELSGTTGRSSLTLKTKNSKLPGDDGLATVGEILASTPLGKLSAKTIDLIGGGIVMTGGGYIGSIQLHDLKNGADIIMPGAGAPRGITIKAGQLYADTDIVLGSYLKSLTAVQWTGSSLTAPWASKIAIKGDRRNGVAGDFGADITLTEADPKRGMSLNKLQVAGRIVGSEIILAGGVGTIMAAQWDTGSLDALWAKNIMTKGNRRDLSTTGDFGADITITGADPKKGISLNKLQVAGTIVGSKITLSGAAGTIMAAQWDSGSLEALWVKNIKTKGNRRDASITGNFSATLDLTGQDSRGISLNKLQVAGTAVDATVRTFGSMGSLMFGAVQGSDFLAGIAGAADRHASAEVDFVNPPAFIKSVKIKGLKVPKGEVAPRFYTDSNFSAATLGTVKLLNVDYENGDEPFGLFALDQGTETHIKSISLKDTITGEKWKWPEVPVGDEVDFVVQVI